MTKTLKTRSEQSRHLVCSLTRKKQMCTKINYTDGSRHHDFDLPSPYTASFQALSVNAFRWRIRDQRPGDGLKNFLGPRDPKRIGCA